MCMKNKGLKYFLVGLGAVIKVSWSLEANCPTIKNKEFEKNYFQKNKVEYIQQDTTNFKRNYEFKDSCKNYVF